METRGAGDRIPEELRIEMRVEVDKTRRHRKAVGINDPICASIDPPSLNDATVLDGDIAKKRGQTAAIVNPTTFDQHIIRHKSLPPLDLAGS